MFYVYKGLVTLIQFSRSLLLILNFSQNMFQILVALFRFLIALNNVKKNPNLN